MDNNPKLKSAIEARFNHLQDDQALASDADKPSGTPYTYSLQECPACGSRYYLQGSADKPHSHSEDQDSIRFPAEIEIDPTTGLLFDATALAAAESQPGTQAILCLAKLAISGLCLWTFLGLLSLLNPAPGWPLLVSGCCLMCLSIHPTAYLLELPSQVLRRALMRRFGLSSTQPTAHAKKLNWGNCNRK